MALVKATLVAALQPVLDLSTSSPSAAAAGTNWAAAYATYAAAGAANGIPVVILPTSTTALGAAIGAAFSTLPGVPATVAAGLAAALVAFWGTVTVAGAVGAPNAAGLAAAFVAPFQTVIASASGSAASKASSIADALDAATKAVVVTFPGGATFPIS